MNTRGRPRSAVDVVAATKALADPVRWGIAEQLAEGPRSASELGKGFDISAPAISRHLKVLLGGGIVDVESKGRRRVYSLRAQTLWALSEGLRDLAGQTAPPPRGAAQPRRRRPISPSRASAPATDWRSW